VAVCVTVGLRVLVGVKEAVTVAVELGMEVGLGVKNGSRQTGAESLGPSGSRVEPCSSYNLT
jgi:hypothetical protein